MGLRSEDAKLELGNTRKVMQDDNSTVNEKLQAVHKLVEIVLKVALDTRDNTVRTMKKVGAEMRKPKVRTEEKPENETTKE